MALHKLYGVVFDTTLITGCTSLSIEVDPSNIRDTTAGDVYNHYISMASQATMLRFSTLHIATAWAECGLTGTSIADLAAGLAFYHQAVDEGGTFKSGANHLKTTINEGLVVPSRLSVNHRGDATITYDVHPTYDDSNDPIEVAGSQALTGTLSDAERFTLPTDGGVVIESVSLTDFRGIDIDFGVRVRREAQPSEVWPNRAFIDAISPTITIRGVNPEWLGDSAIPLSGKSATHADTTIYLRRRAEGGTFDADNASTHIAISAAGLAHVRSTQAAGTGLAETNLVLETNYDGTNAPITLTTGQDIT